MQTQNAGQLQNYFKTSNKINIWSIVFKERDELIKLRRHFHRHPELSFKEHKTAQFIVQYLKNLSSSFIIKTNIAQTGVTALLTGTAGKGPCIGLRADMDALPVQEKDNDPAYMSINDGVSHACGHDAHVAILLVAAKVLCAMRNKLRGSVKFIFQPAEENGGGAEHMVKQHALKHPDVDQIYGLHVISILPVGTVFVNCEPKPMMAGCASFHIDITGLGGHAAMPHMSKDAVLASTSLVQQIHTIVSRNIAPSDMAVVHVGKINSGYKDNVVADRAEIGGSLRWYKDEVGDTMKKRLKQLCKGIEVAYDVKVELSYPTNKYPPLVNERLSYQVVCDAARKVVNDGLDADSETAPGSEDFPYYLQQIPGAFFFVGAKVEDGKDRIYMHHVADFKIDERCLLIGCQMFVQIVSALLVDGKGRPASKL